MTTLTATTARREFFDLVKGAAEGHKTFRIQHRRGAAVLLSEDDYEGLLETLELLSLPGLSSYTGPGRIMESEGNRTSPCRRHGTRAPDGRRSSK